MPKENHPTAAGLLMFGYKYEITREFPSYFLDYQENRMVEMSNDGSILQKDRIWFATTSDDQKASKPTRKKQILDLIQEYPSISRLELAKRLGLHDSTIKRRLERLVAEGYIMRIVADKGGYWEVIKQML